MLFSNQSTPLTCVCVHLHVAHGATSQIRQNYYCALDGGANSVFVRFLVIRCETCIWQRDTRDTRRNCELHRSSNYCQVPSDRWPVIQMQFGRDVCFEFAHCHCDRSGPFLSLDDKSVAGASRAPRCILLKSSRQRKHDQRSEKSRKCSQKRIHRQHTVKTESRSVPLKAQSGRDFGI